MQLNHSTVPATEKYPVYDTAIPQIKIEEGPYIARFARTREELDAVLKLRFEVFNLELQEGLDLSFQTGRDQDEFDLHCHHLIVLETRNEKIVGTYRVQTGEMAARGRGFYSSGEFDLSHLPTDVLSGAVELGRACIDRSNRTPLALFMLWKGLAAYMVHNRKRYLFGCCSLTSQNPHEGKRVMELLEEGGHLHPSFYVPPKEGFECYPEGFVADPSLEVSIPRLFSIYLRYGAKACGPPVIDRMFKTIDFFVVFDADEMDDQARRAFFGV